MSFIHAIHTKVFGGKHDLSAYFNGVDVDGTIDLAETSTFGNTFKTFVSGLKDATAALTGFFDGDADAVDDYLNGVFSTSDQWTVGLGGDTAPDASTHAGTPAKVMLALEKDYKVSSKINAAVSVSATLQAISGVIQGVFLHSAAASENAPATFEYHDNGAATAAGGAANLHVTAVTGPPGTCTILVEDSVDHAIWTTLCTFDNVTAAVGQQKTFTGTVKRYTRCNLSALDTGTVTFAVAVARY